MAPSPMKSPAGEVAAESVKSVQGWSHALDRLTTAARAWADEEEEVSTSCNELAYSPIALLKFRSSMCPDDDNDDVRSSMCKARLQPLMHETAPSPKSKVVAPVRYYQTTRTPGTTKNVSKGAPSASSPSCQEDDEKVGRAARSILDKLSLENFDSLLEQLIVCVGAKSEHISKCINAVFDTATMEQHTIPMYADLCAKLDEDARIASAMDVGGHKHAFRRLLLSQCQLTFEQCLEPSEVAPRSRQESLGGMKLIGHILIRGLVSSKMLVEFADTLIDKRVACPEALESLAALVMVAAPTFDSTEWQHHDKLDACFATMRKLSKEKSVLPRCRMLLRDVLDAREAGWPRSTKNVAVIHAEQTPSEREVPVADNAAVSKTEFDLKTFRRHLSAILSDLESNRNVAAAVNRMRVTGVPQECQADQFADIITRIVEDKRGPSRRCAMAFAAGLAAADESAFDREQCLAGIASFFQDVYPDLCTEVPRLPSIVRTELTPTLCSVFQKAEIDKCLPPGIRC